MAAGCNPCKLVSPIVEEISIEYGPGCGRAASETLKVVAIDTDEVDESFPEAWGVESIPTLLLMRNGAIVEKLVGAVPRSALLTVLRNTFDGLPISGQA